MKRLLSTLWIILVMAGNGFGQETPAKHHSQYPLNCQECHLCKKPTAEKPCLKICPDFVRKGVETKHTLKEAPEIIEIDSLSRQFTGVVFSHKMHAEMAQMSGGCTTCHHHNPPGKILKCSACHSTNVRGTQIGKPDLEGAYHRLCIDCHRSWDTRWVKKTDCSTCHTPKTTKTSQAVLAAKVKLIQNSHNDIQVPLRFVLKSDNEDAPWVTFHHGAHAKKYVKKCTACHQNETCVQCHGIHPKRRLSHDTCVSCHEKDIDENCEKCHSEKPKP